MREKWTGRLIGKMHNNGISYADVAKEVGVTKAYISMILNGARKPKDSKRRLEEAVDSIMCKRNSEN